MFIIVYDFDLLLPVTYIVNITEKIIVCGKWFLYFEKIIMIRSDNKKLGN